MPSSINVWDLKKKIWGDFYSDKITYDGKELKILISDPEATDGEALLAEVNSQQA